MPSGIRRCRPRSCRKSCKSQFSDSWAQFRWWLAQWNGLLIWNAFVVDSLSIPITPKVGSNWNWHSNAVEIMTALSIEERAESEWAMFGFDLSLWCFSSPTKRIASMSPLHHNMNGPHPADRVFMMWARTKEWRDESMFVTGMYIHWSLIWKTSPQSSDPRTKIEGKVSEHNHTLFMICKFLSSRGRGITL